MLNSLLLKIRMFIKKWKKIIFHFLFKRNNQKEIPFNIKPKVTLGNISQNGGNKKITSGLGRLNSENKVSLGRINSGNNLKSSEYFDEDDLD